MQKQILITKRDDELRKIENLRMELTRRRHVEKLARNAGVSRSIASRENVGQQMECCGAVWSRDCDEHAPLHVCRGRTGARNGPMECKRLAAKDRLG